MSESRRRAEMEEGSSIMKQATDKICKTCTDFKSFVRRQGKDPRGSKSDEASVRDDCPVDKNELGRNSWSLLHTMAANYPEEPSLEQQKDMDSFIRVFSKLYPCEYCAKDLRADIANSPPKVKSGQELALWFCELHNKVNARTGKAQFDCKLVNERWKDGWKDGSCS